jgi:hypothetical protein
MNMRKLLLTTACLLVLGGYAQAVPCSKEVQALQRLRDVEATRTDKIANKCSPEWFTAFKRYLEVTRRYETAAQRDKGSSSSPLT